MRPTTTKQRLASLRRYIAKVSKRPIPHKEVLELIRRKREQLGLNKPRQAP